jgi:hypothetical protein
LGRGKNYQPEQVLDLLSWQIEVVIANGKMTAVACKEARIVVQTYSCWRKEYGGLQMDQATGRLAVGHFPVTQAGSVENLALAIFFGIPET